MKKFFKQHIIPLLDKATIEGEPINSLDLMERAATTISQWIFNNDDILPANIIVMAGPGNNGGDGLVVARQLINAYSLSNIVNVEIHTYTSTNGNRSKDCLANIKRLDDNNIPYDTNNFEPSFPNETLIIDALFGTGLSRPIDGKFKDLIDLINNSGCDVLSIDIPSGLGDEDTFSFCDSQTIIKAKYTISFQFPKLCHMLPELEQYVGEPHYTIINLLQSAIDNQQTEFYYTTKSEIRQIIHHRSRFAHKGSFGRAMIFAGSFGMMGAATMAVCACKHSGVGLITAVVPRCGYEIMQISEREAMTICSDKNDIINWHDSMYDSRINAVGIGPGLGRDDSILNTLRNVLNNYGNKVPIVIDADALYHLAYIIKNENFQLPQNCILTPHDFEFDRLTCKHDNRLNRIYSAQAFAVEHKTTIILKGANTVIAFPDGRLCFNTTGNVGMATGGSGDILTGLLTGLLAQEYSIAEAAELGVGLHGLAGDCAANKYNVFSMSACDILNNIHKAYSEIS